MKVIHIVPSLAEGRGGPSRAALDMCRYQNLLGINAEIATAHGIGEPSVNARGVLIHSFKSYFDGYMYPGLEKWIRAEIGRYDIVHIHSIFHWSTLVAVREARRNSIPYIIRPLGHLYRWSLKNRSGIKKKLFLLCGGSKALEEADGIHLTAVHEGENLAVNVSNKNQYVLPLGVASMDAVPRARFEELFPFLLQKNVLLFLSRVHLKKGLELLLPAIADLLKKKGSWVLVVAGDGDGGYLNKIRALAKENGISDKVFFVGFVKGELKAALLRNSKAFILPSYSENFAVAAAEAMRAGLPVLVSQEVAIATDVSEHNAGLVFDLEVGAIRSAVERVMVDEPWRATAAMNAEKTARALYNWETITERQVAIYSEIINNKKAQTSKE